MLTAWGWIGGVPPAPSLPEPATAPGRAALAALLADPARAVVAVDYDGTLAPIVERPEDARPAPGAVEALRVLADRVGTCAVISGRAAADVVALGGLEAVRGLEVRGHYGLERYRDGRLESPPADPGVETARSGIAALLADAPPGVHVEDKGHSLVVHTRPADDPAGALAALTPRLMRLAADTGLEAVPGRLVLELRPAGIDKGGALEALAAESDARSVVYIGDDLGDVPAFDVVSELRRRGVPGLTVASAGDGADDAPAELAARADLVLRGPAEVVEFLTALAAAVGEI